MSEAPKKAAKSLGSKASPSILGQVILLSITSLILDLGISFNLVLISTIAYWAAALMIWHSRKESLTKFDSLYLRYGFFIVVLITLVLGPMATYYIYFRLR